MATANETRESYEQHIISKHGRPIAAVTLSNGGRAYVRRPKQEEYDEMQALSQTDDGEAKRVAFARYVMKCFAGALDGNGNEMTFDDVRNLEGPAFVAGGVLGGVVNRLAGSGERTTTFL